MLLRHRPGGGEHSEKATEITKRALTASAGVRLKPTLGGRRDGMGKVLSLDELERFSGCG